jgi:tetratricopeptide (TPR) repeat protein
MFVIGCSTLILLLLTTVPASASSQSHHASKAGAPGASGPAVPLLEGLGDHHYPVTTRDSLAQRYFDQGLRLTYAFNHAEAIRAFDEAARIDPECAMCYWGKALALGPNINAPMDSASGVQAYAAVQRALAASGASGRERALIRALATRYAPAPPTDRAGLDSAYARAMRDVVRSYPNDLDAATLYAESLMDLSPWNYWTSAAAPRPDTPEILVHLERVLAANRDHPGACHYYIHAVEAAHPDRAVACAERLAALMPAAGHLVHMPAHIYIRVGRWNDAITANQHAVHADESYIADQRVKGFYTVAYYPHNYHFLAFASTMAGRSASAVEAARAAAAKIPADVARGVPELQLLIAYPHLTLATFGRWNDVLNKPLPPADLRVATGLAWYARGVALAAKRQWAAAAAARDTVRQIWARTTHPVAKTVLEIAAHALAGEIASRRGRAEESVEHFRAAMALEDGLMYMEPPHWHYPIRHSLAAALLATGRAAEAENLYREDLKRFPENGWSLFGLSRSLAMQGRSQEAEAVKRRFERAWQHADVALTASRF